MTKETERKLIELALENRKKSYAPYSKFKVGAALLTADGTIIGGCNIENAAYTPTNCAERTAFFSAVRDGYRDFTAIAVFGGYDGEKMEICAPCGVCRQVMMEFCDPKTFQIIIGTGVDDYKVVTLEELVPYGFSPKNLTLA